MRNIAVRGVVPRMISPLAPLVLLSLLLSPSRVPAAGSAGGGALDSAWKASLVSLRVQYQMDTVAIDRREDGLWMLRHPRLPASPARVDEAWDLLASLGTDDTVLARAEGANLESYGLDPVEARTVDLTFASGESMRFYLGRSAAQPGTTYWMREPPGAIFRTAGFAWSVSAERWHWVEKRLFPKVGSMQVESIRAEWIDSNGTSRRYKVVRAPSGGLRLVEPDSLAGREVYQAGGIFFEAGALLMDAFSREGEFTPGEKRAQISLWIETADTVITLKTEGTEGRFYFVRHPVGGLMVKMFRSRFDTFKITPADLMIPPPFGPEPDPGFPTTPPPGFGVYAPHRDAPPDDDRSGEDSPHED